MRFSIYKLLYFLVLSIILIGAVQAAVLPAGISEFDFLYDRFERLDALSLDKYDFQLGPYTLDREDFSISPFEEYFKPKSESINLFAILSEDFRSVKLSRGNGIENIRGGLSFSPSKNLFFFSNFVLDEKKAKDPNYTGKKWRGFAGKVENSIAVFKLNNFRIMLGRFASFWGERNSLLLAPSTTMDGLEYNWKYGRLTFSYRLAQLDRTKVLHNSNLENEDRYFAGHRLDIDFSDNFRLGIFETVVFGGIGRNVEFYYLNPIMMYHSNQLNKNRNDNTFLGFDFSYKPQAGIKFYGQLLIDDFQIDNEIQSDQEPNEIGYLAGAYFVDVLDLVDIKAEYSRVNNWTFNQVLDRNRYLNDGNLIGGALGNDYDRYSLKVMRWFTKSFEGILLLSYHRQGEGRVTAEWSEPWMDIDGDYQEPFPTGQVEKRFNVSVGVKGFIADHFYCDVETGLEHISNFSHIEDENQSLPFIRIKFSGFLNSLVNIK